MSTYDSPVYFPGKEEYSSDPIVSHVGDFTPFYITIAICSVILGFIIVLNIYCSCSKYADYWMDRHTGNRYIVSIWSTTPQKQWPLDLSELQGPIEIHYERCLTEEYEDYQPTASELPTSEEFLELQQRESHI